MTSRFTKPLLRTHAPHCGQRGQEGGRRARAASTDSTRWLARTRANDHAARISAESVWASSTVQSKRCTAGSSSRMLSLRHSIGHRSPFGTRPGGSKSVPYVCCYASPPPTVNYAHLAQDDEREEKGTYVLFLLQKPRPSVFYPDTDQLLP